jgi:hypothetical protein
VRITQHTKLGIVEWAHPCPLLIGLERHVVCLPSPCQVVIVSVSRADLKLLATTSSYGIDGARFRTTESHSRPQSKILCVRSPQHLANSKPRLTPLERRRSTPAMQSSSSCSSKDRTRPKTRNMEYHQFIFLGIAGISLSGSSPEIPSSAPNHPRLPKGRVGGPGPAITLFEKIWLQADQEVFEQ